jgi:inhibitor of KinA sporulation pathway (predicted exonuclease)
MSIDYAKILCFDMEMCCWPNRGPGEIISIGVCELNLENSQISRKSHHLVKPRAELISPFCTDLTGITQRMVDKEGRPLEDVLNTVRNQYGSKRPYAAWGSDAEYLAAQCRRFRIRTPIKAKLDIELLYRIKRRSSESVGLTDALRRQGIEFEGQAHNALADAINLARLVVADQLL